MQFLPCGTSTGTCASASRSFVRACTGDQALLPIRSFGSVSMYMNTPHTFDEATVHIQAVFQHGWCLQSEHCCTGACNDRRDILRVQQRQDILCNTGYSLY